MPPRFPLLVGKNQARPVGVTVGPDGSIYVAIAYMAHNEGSPIYASDLVCLTFVASQPVARRRNDVDLVSAPYAVLVRRSFSSLLGDSPPRPFRAASTGRRRAPTGGRSSRGGETRRSGLFGVDLARWGRRRRRVPASNSSGWPKTPMTRCGSRPSAPCTNSSKTMVEPPRFSLRGWPTPIHKSR